MEKRFEVFADRFHELRRGMSQKKFAEWMGLSRPTVGFYENGERLPDVLTLKQIAEKAEVSADWLIGLSDIRSPDPTAAAASLYTGLDDTTISILHDCETGKLDFFRGSPLSHEKGMEIFNSLICTIALNLSGLLNCIDSVQSYTTKILDDLNCDGLGRYTGIGGKVDISPESDEVQFARYKMQRAAQELLDEVSYYTSAQFAFENFCEAYHKKSNAVQNEMKQDSEAENAEQDN